MLILEFIATAVEGSEILALTAELDELTFKEVFPVRVFKDVESLDKALFISPIAEIAVFLASILD